MDKKQRAPVLRMDSVSKWYGSHQAVRDADLWVAQGEVLGLLGPNGAGKSTLMSMMSGLCKPNSGRVDIAGWGSPTDAEVRRRIGVAPQSRAVYAELTLWENVSLFASLYGLRGRNLRRRTEEALALLGLMPIAQHRAGTCSGGQQQRLNVACALAHHPDLLILDEPTVGIDPTSRSHLLKSIAALSARGTTVVYSTHHMEEAEALCDRVAIMDGGTIVASNTPAALVQTYGGKPQIEVELEHIPSSWNGPGRLRGNRLVVESPDPQGVVSWLMDAGIGFRSLQLSPPKLETAFLALTGRAPSGATEPDLVEGAIRRVPALRVTDPIADLGRVIG